MTWTPLMRGLLALALVQALLGGVLTIVGTGNNGVSVDDPGGVPTTEVPGPPPDPGEAPGSPVDGTPPPVPGEPPPGGPTDPTIPPTGAGRSADRVALVALQRV